VQHLAGLVTGVLTYVLLTRLDIRRSLALAAAALVLLDSYAIALEQHVLTETFFGLTMLGVACAAILSRGAGGLALSGALLAAAVTIRSNGLFAVPVWLLYVLWDRRSLLAMVMGVVSLSAVLFGYAALHAHGDPTRNSNPGELSLTEMDGWFLYARVAVLADCNVAHVPQRALAVCQPPEERIRDAQFYLFNPSSPAKLLVGVHRTGSQQAADNRMLRGFALAVIRSRPGAYARLVGGDLVRLFTPHGKGVDVTVQFLRPGPTVPGGGRAPLPCSNCDVERSEPVPTPDRNRWFPHFRPRVHAPARLLVAYQRWFHTPRWLMGLLAALALVSTALALTPLRHALTHRRETFLLGCSGLAIAVGSVATANPLVRFLVPLVPLLVCGGACALTDFARARERQR